MAKDIKIITLIEGEQYRVCWFGNLLALTYTFEKVTNKGYNFTRNGVRFLKKHLYPAKNQRLTGAGKAFFVHGNLIITKA